MSAALPSVRTLPPQGVSSVQLRLKSAAVGAKLGISDGCSSTAPCVDGAKDDARKAALVGGLGHGRDVACVDDGAGLQRQARGR